jgi:two-component system cell cycle sensor histidine kinase/response regulator CckA
MSRHDHTVPSEPPRIQGGPGCSEHRGRILVVEDEGALAEMAREILEDLGHIVTLKRNGREAVDFFRTQGGDIDVVIVDMVLPDMDGARAFDEIKRLDPRAKVLISSGFSLDEEAAELLDRGALGFVSKPYSLTKLSRAVGRALRD